MIPVLLSVIVGIAYFLSTALFTRWLAEKKGYSSGLWGVLGLFFGIVALLTVGLAPNIQDKHN
jgi:threonine/homoserine/homoserine lactone efflux protein